MEKIIEKIQVLKKKRNAVILAHNYQPLEVQRIADFCGDSLGLSIEASKTDAQVIVFCGVYFMAETAKIISPDKTVLIPEKKAGCPLANMVTVDGLRALKQKNPDARVVCYVNSSAEVKAESDVCCTSANSVAVVKGMFQETDPVIFVPDKHLAEYTAKVLNRTFIVWPGYCPTHAKILPEDIDEQKKKYPRAQVLSHPECLGGVLNKSDQILSTGGMLRFVAQSQHQEFIIATEKELALVLQEKYPEKKFYPATTRAICPNMKKITLERVLFSLEHMRDEVVVPGDIAQKARSAVERMFLYSK